ncbi:MAG: glucosamine-6-phosphate deaminase [Fimbriimonadaceae bacterium]|nr:glucosamine-6-phosphate deaminase [Fimbriimonadaceae bacterium]
MEVIIRETQQDAVDLTALLLRDLLSSKPHAVLGLATGRTMEGVYRRLVEMHLGAGLDFSLCRTFNLDEYIGLPRGDVGSYRHYMYVHLFQHVNIDLRNTHLPRGESDDLEGECVRYEAAIAECGGIDLQLLGIGRTGHIGFNEPLSAMYSRTRAKALSPETLRQNAGLFDPPSRMPRRALTMGVGTILEARRCLLLATGEEKAGIIAQAVEGPVTSMISATALQLHPRCTVIVDAPAAAHLQNQDYYRWVFENEPEWDGYQ